MACEHFHLKYLDMRKDVWRFVGIKCSQDEFPAEGTFSDLNQPAEGEEKEPNDSSCLCPFSESYPRGSETLQ